MSRNFGGTSEKKLEHDFIEIFCAIFKKKAYMHGGNTWALN